MFFHFLKFLKKPTIYISVCLKKIASYFPTLNILFSNLRDSA